MKKFILKPMFDKTFLFVFSFFFVLICFSTLSAQPSFAAETTTNCWVTDFGTPPNDFPVPESCGRGRIPCTPGYMCAYRNLVDFYKLGDGWGAGRNHQGVDLLAYQENPLYAIENAIVVSSRFEGCNRPGVPNTPGSHTCSPGEAQSTGWHVKLYDKNNRYHFYMHLVRKSTLQVGQTIRAGDVVGNTGTTGDSGTPHLHYQIGNPVSQTGYYSQQGWADTSIVLKNWPGY